MFPAAPAAHGSDAKYRAIFDLANDAFFVHDAATGAILDTNQKATELYGYSADEMARLTVADLSAGDPAATQSAALDHLVAAAAGAPQVFEWAAKHRTGGTFWVEVNLKQATIEGRPLLLAIVRDITTRKRDEREIAASHRTQTTLNAVLRLALDDLTLDEVLRRAVTLVDEALGLRTEICLTGPDGACASDPDAIPIVARTMTLGALRVRRDAADHSLDEFERQFLDAFASTLAGIIVRKRAEQDLAHADDRIREQAALVRLGEMAAVVAHEVRNPLAGIRGALQVIGGRLPMGERDATIVSEMIARLDGLNELMTDLLLFARPPQPHCVPVDMLQLAQETSSLAAQDATARKVRFVVDGTPQTVQADPKLLKSVLLNVLINAAHAVQHDGTVRTSVVARDQACVLAVSDTGPGIPADIRDRIFIPFFTTKARGTGLGLPTAKRLVEAHRGRISVTCPTGGGTTVTIELPRV